MKLKPLAALIMLIGPLVACTMTPRSEPDSAAKSRIATAGRTLVPHAAWNCGMAEGIPVPESGTLLVSAEIALDNVYNVGKTPFGQRRVAVTQEGKMSGARLTATVLPGGLDFELGLSNGVQEIEQILVLQTSDNGYLIMRNAGTGVSGNDVRIVYDFEAPTAGEYAWLNTGKYVGRRTIDSANRTMKLAIYDVSNVAVATDGAHVTKVEKPVGVPAQPWDFRKPGPGEERGETILVESVALGRSQALQNGKRGSRNVIPINGGTLEGMVSGKVLFGGADYQSPTTGPAIDARYLWQTAEGDVIVVRNAGPFNQLIPTFETRVDGKYAWLNSGKYSSSAPGAGGGKGGGLSIAMYKVK
ncbi:MAG: DUF3237 family protein [Pseudomonadota bacterium]